MDVCFKDQSGQLPGKTIVFAMTKAHAHRIAEVFEEMYPQHVGVAQVVTSTTERVRDGSYGDGLITKFKKNDRPRVAVSVDMLDTGVDIPEVVNLIFMKPVQSRIKLWQMIGRGTRSHQTLQVLRSPARRAQDRIQDHRFLAERFRQEGRRSRAVRGAGAGLDFQHRLKLLASLLADHESRTYKQTVSDLRAMLERIPRGSFPCARYGWKSNKPGRTPSGR